MYTYAQGTPGTEIWSLAPHMSQEKCSSGFLRRTKDLRSSYVLLKGQSADFAASKASCITSSEQDPTHDKLILAAGVSDYPIRTERGPDACRVEERNLMPGELLDLEVSKARA